MGGPPAVSDAIASATPFRLHPGCVWDSEDFKEEGNLTPSWMLSCCEYLFFLEEQLRDSEAGVVIARPGFARAMFIVIFSSSSSSLC